MKTGLLVLAVLAVAQMGFAAKNVSRIEIEQRMGQKDSLAKHMIQGKTAKVILDTYGTHVNKFADLVGSDSATVASNLARRPELLESYTYVDMIKGKSDVSLADRQNAENASVILKSLGKGAGVKDGEIQDAKLDGPAVWKMAEILPLLASYGDKAVKMGEVMALEVKSGKSLNNALRSAAEKVLGLKGSELDTFMRDPKKGLADCDKTV